MNSHQLEFIRHKKAYIRGRLTLMYVRCNSLPSITTNKVSYRMYESQILHRIYKKNVGPYVPNILVSSDW